MDRATIIADRDAGFISKTREQLERSMNAHRGQLTRIVNRAKVLLTTNNNSPSRRNTQEIELVKKEMDYKKEDIEAGYMVLSLRYDAEDAKVAAFELLVNACITLHQETTAEIMTAMAYAPVAHPQAAAPTGGGQVKLKDSLKPKTLTMEFLPQEYQAWQTKFKIYY